MTTLRPREPYTPAELAELYPPSLQLQLVQILLRHGERTPVSARFQHAGLPAFWPYCSAVRQLKTAVLDLKTGTAPGGLTGAASVGGGDGGPSFTTLEWRRRLETFGPDDVPVVATGPGAELDDVCDMGSLTDLGRQTTYLLGTRLRHLYVDQLGFLPPTVGLDISASPSPSSPPQDLTFLYLRSTPVPRALESLQQALRGLYPAGTLAPAVPPPTILTRAPADETLFPNDSLCRRFAALSRAYAQRAATRWNGSPELAYVQSRIGRWMTPDSPTVAVNAKPRLSGIMDTINATDAHGPATRLPDEFYDAKMRRMIERIGVEEWFAGYGESREYRTLGIGGLMGDVVARMMGSVEAQGADGTYEVLSPGRGGKGGKEGDGTVPRITPIKFGMSGCHDTTLAAVLSSLGAMPKDQWPPFTSHIAIEMFRRADVPPAVPSGNLATLAPESLATASSSPTSPPASFTSPPASTSSLSSWFASLLGNGSNARKAKAGTPPPGIGRRPLERLSLSEKQKLDGYYVRLRYNDVPVTIPGCRLPGKHLEGDESFCTLEAFKAIVDKYTPANWREECRAVSNAPMIPEKPEPAGF